MNQIIPWRIKKKHGSVVWPNPQTLEHQEYWIYKSASRVYPILYTENIGVDLVVNVVRETMRVLKNEVKTHRHTQGYDDRHIHN